MGAVEERRLHNRTPDQVRQEKIADLLYWAEYFDRDHPSRFSSFHNDKFKATIEELVGYLPAEAVRLADIRLQARQLEIRGIESDLTFIDQQPFAIRQSMESRRLELVDRLNSLRA
jgi:hypothetical protein